tara:strand:+ start:1587 stop:2210 length:624 start_codon:yes stop_codon:yes gene_type:complete
MIEIVPNWHPLAVHFPVALVMTSTLFFLAGLIFKSNLSKELLAASKWCLWSAGVAAIVAATFGWFAYNSVAHDEPSHAAMTLHKEWAIPTAVFISLLALYAYAIRDIWGRKKKVLVAILLISASLLTSITGWLGGEAVYRYGIGVMRIPNADDHSHSGAESEDHDDSGVKRLHDDNTSKELHGEIMKDKPHDDSAAPHGKAGNTHAH